MKKGLRKISRLLKSAYVRTFSARERILLFTRGGQKPALALPALQSPHPGPPSEFTLGGRAGLKFAELKHFANFRKNFLENLNEKIFS